MSFGQADKFLCRKEMVWLALLVTTSTCLFQVSLLSMVTPRYLALFVSLSTWKWILYDVWTIFRLLVILMCSHLSGLKTICQSLSHSCRWSRSSCSDAASSWFDITLYNRQSSAKIQISWLLRNLNRLIIVLFCRTYCRQMVNIRFQDTHNKKKPPVKFKNSVCWEKISQYLVVLRNVRLGAIQSDFLWNTEI